MFVITGFLGHLGSHSSAPVSEHPGQSRHVRSNVDIVHVLAGAGSPRWTLALSSASHLRVHSAPVSAPAPGVVVTRVG